MTIGVRKNGTTMPAAMAIQFIDTFRAKRLDPAMDNIGSQVPRYYRDIDRNTVWM